MVLDLSDEEEKQPTGNYGWLIKGEGDLHTAHCVLPSVASTGVLD